MPKKKFILELTEKEFSVLARLVVDEQALPAPAYNRTNGQFNMACDRVWDKMQKLAPEGLIVAEKI